MRNSFKISKMAQAEEILPGFKKAVWAHIKKITGTSQRGPKTLIVTDQPYAVMLNDGECGKRFAINLETMKVSPETYHISSGEWACHGGRNNDGEIQGVPSNMAVVTVEWQEYYRTMTVTIQTGNQNVLGRSGESRTFPAVVKELTA